MKQITEYKWFIIIGVALLAAVLGGFLFFKFKTPSLAFAGNFSRVADNSIFVTIGKDSADQEFIVTSATKFQRIALHIPTAEELKKTGGKFMVDDLKKDTNDTDFQTFKQDANASSGGIGLEIVAAKDIWNSSRFNAQTITYRLAIYPK